MKSILSTEEYLASHTPHGEELDVDMLCAMERSMRKSGAVEVYDDWGDVSEGDPVYHHSDLQLAFTECVLAGMRSNA